MQGVSREWGHAYAFLNVFLIERWAAQCSSKSRTQLLALFIYKEAWVSVPPVYCAAVCRNRGTRKIGAIKYLRLLLRLFIRSGRPSPIVQLTMRYIYLLTGFNQSDQYISTVGISLDKTFIGFCMIYCIFITDLVLKSEVQYINCLTIYLSLIYSCMNNTKMVNLKLKNC